MNFYFCRYILNINRGTPDEKIRFVFNMYDTSRNGTVSKAELTTLLNHSKILFLT